jgi:hypothetical protein
MRLSRRLLPGAFLLLPVVWGCHPYDAFKDEFNAGAIDPFNFAPPYRTSNGNANNQLASFGTPSTCSRTVAGSCSIVEARAYLAANVVIGYFRFPFSPSQITTWQYPPVNFTGLRVTGTGAVPTPNAYVFDGSVSPAGDSTSCVAPTGYSYNPFRDDLHYDQQGNIFSTLPNATWNEGSNPSWTYVPVVARVPVTSQGEHCQAIKSEQTVLTRSDVSVQRGPDRPDGTPTGVPDGTYLAWAIIDPGSPVLKYNDPANAPGISHQRYGWFNQYFVAYLDGGPIPVASGQMQTQRVFYPRTNVLFSCTTASDCLRFPGAGLATTSVACETATGLCRTATQCPAAPNTCATVIGAGSTCDTSVIPNLCRQQAAGQVGRLSQGYDVLEFGRTDASYSPVCLVQSYAMPTPPTRTSDLPQSAADITSGAFQVQPPPAPGTPGGVVTPTHIFCLQVP